MNCDVSELHAAVSVRFCVLRKVALDWHLGLSGHSSPASWFCPKCTGCARAEGGVSVHRIVDIAALAELQF